MQTPANEDVQHARGLTLSRSSTIHGATHEEESESGTGSKAPFNLPIIADGSSTSTPQIQTGQDEAMNHKEKDDRESFQVKWDEDDPENPLNWPAKQKAWITFQLGQIALVASLGSSIITPAETVIAEEFGISQEVAVLSLSLYILGFAVGPLIWAPISEIWGRRIGMLPAMLGLALFSIGVATSQNAQSIFILRFFSGVCGSAPIANVSAAMGDIYLPRVRGTAVSFFSVAVTGGPTIGPVIGAALTYNPHLGWRWTGYILAIWSAAIFVLLWFCLPELYAPYLLKQRAHQMRRETGDDRWWHPHEETKINLKSIVSKHFTRPILMLVTEPVVTALALYASYVYGLFYMSLEIFPIVFEQNRGWGHVVSTLPFLSLFVGVVSALVINIGNQGRVVRAIDGNEGKPVPEVRLVPMSIGGILFVIGLFWFGWTADPSIPWISCVIAAAFVGCGFVIIFQQCINFMVDTYVIYAASAVAANTFLRSFLAAGMPLAVNPMFRTLGVGPAMSLMGGLAALALPVPFVLMKYGAALRRRSKFAPTDD